MSQTNIVVIYDQFPQQRRHHATRSTKSGRKTSELLFFRARFAPFRFFLLLLCLLRRLLFSLVSRVRSWKLFFLVCKVAVFFDLTGVDDWRKKRKRGEEQNFLHFFHIFSVHNLNPKPQKKPLLFFFFSLECFFRQNFFLSWETKRGYITVLQSDQGSPFARERTRTL